MKKITKFLLFVLFLVLPNYVLAYEFKCDEGEHEFESYFRCTLTGNIDTRLDSISGTIEKNDYVSCLTSTIGDGLISDDGTTNNSEAFHLKGKNTTEQIITYRCQVIQKLDGNATTQLFINDFKYQETSKEEASEILRSNTLTIKEYDENKITEPVVTKPRDTSNSNTRLKAIQDPNLNITFSGFIPEYKTEVLYEVEKLDLKILPNNPNSTIRVEGDMNLKVGSNVIDIYVTSPDGTATTCYTLTVIRLARGEDIYYPESDASLKSLTITGHSISFEPSKLEYTIHLDRDTSFVEVNAVANVETATVDISNTDNLTNGSVINITITSQDGTNEVRYRIKVTKEPPKKDYSTLITLGCIGLGVVGIIFLIILSNKKNKKDPLLRLKNDKRKVNRGEKFDPNIVPEANSQISTPEANVIRADSTNIVTPTAVTTPVDTNLNKVTTNVNTINLNNAAIPAQPTNLNNVNPVPVNNQMPQQIPNPPQMPNNINTQQQPSNGFVEIDD